jgi:hypothetical protein
MTMNGLGLGAGLVNVVVHRVWPEVVGEVAARRTRPGLLRNGRLEVTVGDAVWLQQLMMLKPVILARLESHLGSQVVRDIFFSVGALSPPVARPGSVSRGKGRQLSAEMQVRLQGILQPVQDPDCREVLTRLLRKAWGAE